MPERRAASGPSRISAAFESRGGSAALMPYLMGGYPDCAGSLRVGEALVEAGADLVEVGVPFSDPLADGPVIQAAGLRALEAGATFATVVENVAAPLARSVPVVLMCYVNQIQRRGLEPAAAKLGGVGVAGLIVPDLPAEEAGELREVCDAYGVALVPLLAPTTPMSSVRRVAGAARGFIYVVSVSGVTGERGVLPADLRAVVEGARSQATVPIAVGFGISTPEQVAEVGAIADGVIIGSRLVRALAEASSLEEGLDAVRELVRGAAQALA